MIAGKLGRRRGALAVQAAFALTAATLVSRARRTSTERVPGGVPAGEGA